MSVVSPALIPDVPQPLCFEDKETDLMLDIVEKACIVALAIFLCYTNWKLFVPYFLVGTALGVYAYYKEERKPRPIDIDCHDGSCKKKKSATCSQGFIEGVTGVELPRPVAFAANLGVTITHVVNDPHCAIALMPFSALLLGAAFGRYMCYYGSLAKAKFSCLQC